MKEKSKITRREFLELTAVASGEMALNSLGCTFNNGREDYKIFSSGQIGNLQLKNRLIRSATFESAAANGEVTDTYINLLRNLAAGGAGMIITGVLGVFVETSNERTIQIYDDRFIDSLAEVLEEVRVADSQCKLVGQLYHSRDVDGPSSRISAHFQQIRLQQS
jgi:2,4-dienoyl-CoA reductase-like NADH-dependent reductase (Old Yellow Enzyme family)